MIIMTTSYVRAVPRTARWSDRGKPTLLGADNTRRCTSGDSAAAPLCPRAPTAPRDRPRGLASLSGPGLVCRVRNSVPRFVPGWMHRKAEEEEEEAACGANGDDENAPRRRLGAEIGSEFVARDTGD